MSKTNWKNGHIDKNRYCIRKPCKNCGGGGMENEVDRCGKCFGDGEIDTEPGSLYFVLRLDCYNETGKPRDPNAHKALLAYADSVESENKDFAEEIREWLDVIVSHRE